MFVVFDYEIIAKCQYELLDAHNEPFGCGEPATHKVWWSDDGSDAMLVCPEHFGLIENTEE